MQFKSYFTVAVFFIALSVFALVVAHHSTIVVQQGEKNSLQGVSALGVTDLWQQGGEDSCDTDSRITLMARAAGRTAPGCTCKKDSDCALSGSTCDCKRGTDPALRCCHLGSGHVCHSNDECASNNCQSGRCTGGTRPAGSVCSVNEDCGTGHRCVYSPTTGQRTCQPVP